MRPISNDFREALRGIRQLNALVTYESESVSKVLTTELSQDITTELGELLSTELGDVVFEGEKIIRLNPVTNVELFKTICKSVVVEAKEEIPVNTWMNVKIGVLVNNNYEYLDFGDYYITESKYEADTNSYLITAYDKMLESMIPYDLEVPYPITIKNLLIQIFNRLNWDYELGTFVNQDKVLDNDVFSGLNLTFRDVLDDISQVIVGNIKFDKKTVKIAYINELEPPISENNYITEEDLKNVNVTIEKKYGPVNAILISSNGIVLNNLVDSQSIETNGKTEYNFKDNHILIYDSDTYITDMFSSIEGLEYYLYDFDTIGSLIFEPLDRAIVKIGDNEYPTLILNDDIKLTTGLVETMYAEQPKETTQEYIANDKQEKKINDALISIDKANAQLVLKADSNGNVVEARLDANGDDGSSFNVKADNINFSGKTFNLTADNMAINSTNFSVDNDGNLVCSNATMRNASIVNGSIDLTQDESSLILPINLVQNSQYGTFNARFGGAAISFLRNGVTQASLSGGGANIDGGRLRLYNTSHNNTIELTGQTGNITCVSLTQTSKEENKQNFELYNNALKEVLNTDIYKYNLIGEKETDKKHIGFVIGENRNYSHDITALDIKQKEAGVDIYSMVSVLWKAVQEQQEQIEQLKQKINNID